MVLVERIAQWARLSTPRAREIVLEVLNASYPVPIHSKVIYERVRQEYPDEKLPESSLPPIESSPTTIRLAKKKGKAPKPPPAPPHPEHPIRSYKFMKSVVLGDMAHRNLIAKTHSMRPPTAEELAQSKQRLKKSKKRRGTPLVSINVKGMVDQWGWVLKKAEDIEKDKQERLRIQNAIIGQKEKDPKRLEDEKRKLFDEEWGHLNARRRRARVGKLEREDEWARLLQKGRQAGIADAQQTSP